MEQEASRLTPLGKLISVVLILGLIGLGVWVAFGNMGGDGDNKNPRGGGGLEAPKPEAPDTQGVTTVKEYKYVPAERLPSVKGVSSYKWDDGEKILRFSYNVWAGWLPVIAANRGTAPNPESIFAKKYGFRVELVLMDDPVAARDAFAAGEIHALWGTVDMLTLSAPELLRDSRTAPRIVQQIDWSNGGDGIVVRSSIKSIKDLKGKTVTLAQN
jgi:NitT/TauT family transport system substrate-binding protein